MQQFIDFDIPQLQKIAFKLFVDGQYFDADQVLAEIADRNEKERMQIAIRRAQIGMLSDNMNHVSEQLEVARPQFGAHVSFVGMLADMAIRKDDLSSAVTSLRLLGRHARADHLQSFDNDWYQIKHLSSSSVALNNDHALPTFEARVNGVKGRFVIDTGTGHCLLDSDYAERAGIISHNVDQAVFAGGQVGHWHLAKLNKLEMGDSCFERLPVMLTPLADTFRDGFEASGVDGIIGSELIRKVGGIDIDFSQSLFRLGSPGLEHGEALWIAGTHFPLTPCQVNDEPVCTWFIDSGMSGVELAVSESAGRRYKAKFLDGDGQGIGGGGEVKVMPLLIQHFRHGGYEYTNVPAVALPDFKMSKELGIRIGGIIGYSWLAKHRVQLDYKSMRSFISGSSS